MRQQGGSALWLMHCVRCARIFEHLRHAISSALFGQVFEHLRNALSSALFGQVFEHLRHALSRALHSRLAVAGGLYLLSTSTAARKLLA